MKMFASHAKFLEERVEEIETDSPQFLQERQRRA